MRELLVRYSRELLLLEAGSWGTGTFGNPEEGERPQIGNRYQATTGEDKEVWEDLTACCSELQGVWMDDSAIVTWIYVCICSINPITNQNPVCSHTVKSW
jgi:hypothetical protein